MEARVNRVTFSLVYIKLYLLIMCFMFFYYHFVILSLYTDQNVLQLLLPTLVRLGSINRDEKGRFTIFPPRDKQGRYMSVPNDEIIVPLSSEIMELLVGSLLGDGSLRFSKKDKEGKNKI